MLINGKREKINHGFTKVGSCQANQMSIFDKTIDFLDEEYAAYHIYL